MQCVKRNICRLTFKHAYELQSWHWETRNYNKFAEETLRTRLSSIVVTDDAHATVRVASAPDLKAEATINIRKGKKILVFEASFTLKWEGRSNDGFSTKIVHGDAKVFELMQDDVDDEFEVRITIEGSSTDGLDAVCKELMRTRGAAEVRRHLREFSKELLDHDGGQEKLALDAKRRSEEAAKTATAVAETGAEKARIAKEQSEKEAKRKADEVTKAQEREALRPADAPKKVEAASGSGSLWNVNSYHWEEKPLTVWAKERLNELVKGFHIHIPGGHIKIVNVELNGDASCSIRKVCWKTLKLCINFHPGIVTMRDAGQKAHIFRFQNQGAMGRRAGGFGRSGVGYRFDYLFTIQQCWPLDVGIPTCMLCRGWRAGDS
jgi:activator of HSP90 ATPase